MSKPIPIACPALLGTAGYASAASSDASQDSRTGSTQGDKVQQVNVSATRADDTAKVEGTPGPNKRLDQQPKQTANPGADLYGLWKLNPNAQLRLSPTSAIRAYTTLGVRHEMKM